MEITYLSSEVSIYRYLNTQILINLFQEVARSANKVTIELASLTSAASGEYKCEVIAEHPSFRTDIKVDNMTVLGK